MFRAIPARSRLPAPRRTTGRQSRLAAPWRLLREICTRPAAGRPQSFPPPPPERGRPSAPGRPLPRRPRPGCRPASWAIPRRTARTLAATGRGEDPADAPSLQCRAPPAVPAVRSPLRPRGRQRGNSTRHPPCRPRVAATSREEGLGPPDPGWTGPTFREDARGDSPAPRPRPRRGVPHPGESTA